MTTDGLERLRAANPVPATGRVGAPPVFADEPGSRAPSRRVWLLVAAVVAAAAVGVPALAIGFGVIDFESSEPAPPRVVKEFESLSEGAPQGMDPAVIAGETRQVTVDGNTLSIAPTRAGGLCYAWNGSGGCDKLGTVPLSITWVSSGGRGRSVHGVEGFAHARWVDEVEIRLDDGTTVRPQLTWISKPIDAGFFRYVAPEGHAIAGVFGFRDGEEVTGEAIGTPMQPHPYARLDERTKLGEIETAAGPVRLWTAPTKTDGRCVWLEFGGDERAVVPCLPQGYERQTALVLAAHELGGATILAGECGYSAVQIDRRMGRRGLSSAATGSSSRSSSRASSEGRSRRWTKLEGRSAVRASTWPDCGRRAD